MKLKRAQNGMMIQYIPTENQIEIPDTVFPEIVGYQRQFSTEIPGGDDSETLKPEETVVDTKVINEPETVKAETPSEWSDIKSVIKKNEGFVSTAKSLFNEPSASIGYGFFNVLPDGRKIYKGMTITKDEADKQLDIAIGKLSKQVQGYLDKYNIKTSPEQFNVLLDLGYHGGSGLVDRLLKESKGDTTKIGSLLTRYATTAKYGDTSISNALRKRAMRRSDGWNKYTLKGKKGLSIPKFQESGNIETPIQILKENKGIKNHIARLRDPSENTYDFVQQRNLRYDPESKEIKDFFQSYVNSEGFNRILNNQHTWYNKRYPNRSMVFPSQVEKLNKNFKRNIEKDDTVMLLLNGDPNWSGFFKKPNASFRFVFPGGEETESISNDFISGHEYAHSKDVGTYTNGQQRALERNKNTLINNHDEYKEEKHSDIWGLKYLLYKKGIYDSRENENATPEHIEQLRKLYPELRPLQQMSNEEAAWMINNVAANNNSKSKLINLGKNGLKVPKFQPGGISPFIISNIIKQGLLRLIPEHVSVGLAATAELATNGKEALLNKEAIKQIPETGKDIIDLLKNKRDFGKIKNASYVNPGNTFLLDRERQKKMMENFGYHLVNDKDYGGVSNAVKQLNKIVPIYQLGEDEIDSQLVKPLMGEDGKQIIKMDRNSPYSSIRTDESNAIDLPNANNFPISFYEDKNGTIYMRSYDLNDYGVHNQKWKKYIKNKIKNLPIIISNKLTGSDYDEGDVFDNGDQYTYGESQLFANLYDHIGNPFVQRSKLKKATQEEIDKYLNRPIYDFKHRIVGYTGNRIMQQKQGGVLKYQNSGKLPFWLRLAKQLQSAPSNGETTIAAHNADLNRQVEQAREEAKSKGENPDRAEEEVYRRGLMTNGAIVTGATIGALATAAPAVAETVKFATKTPVGRKALQKVMKDTAISMAGGTGVDLLSEKMTGMPFGRYIVGAIPGARDLYDNSGIARFGMDLLNPGYLGLSGSKALIEGAQTGVTNLAHKVDNAATIANARLTGKLKFGNPTTYTGIHQSNIPLTEVKFPFNRWDVTTHGADPNGFWLTLAETPNTEGTMASRPFASRWSASAQKPLIQTGEIHNFFGGKNNLRNAIVKYGKRRGADAFEFKGIKDNALPTTNVVMVTDRTNPILVEQIPQETVRLYRATGTSGKFTPSIDGTTEFAGQWFTSNPQKPQMYASRIVKKARLSGEKNPIELQYIDIPKSEIEKYKASNVLGGRTDVEFEPTEDFLIPLDYPRNRIPMEGYTGNLLHDARLKLPNIYSTPKTSIKAFTLERPILSDGKIIPLSKRDDFSNPDIRYDLPKFAGVKIDTSNPQKRQQLISAFKQRYPQFQQTSEKEFITAGNKYWEVGKMPITEDIKLHKELIKKRLDKLSDNWRETFGYYTDPETHWGNMFSGKTILDKVGENGATVVIPAERSGQFGGFFNPNGSRAGESFVTADAWRNKPIRFTQLHESISHPTDQLMSNVQVSVSKKTIKDLYKRISQPKDLFPDFAKYFNNDASELWFESRATNQEMIKRINEIISKKTGKGLREVYNNPKLLEDYVDKKLVTEDSLIDFLDSMDNAYLSDYATLLEKHSGTKEAKIYANRIRNMIKMLPAIAGIGVIGKTANTKKPNSN